MKTRVSDLPAGVGWRDVLGGGMLGGIGFTMSLFIANLAFRGDELLNEAKLAILLTSAVAGVLGYVFLRLFSSTARGGDESAAAEA